MASQPKPTYFPLKSLEEGGKPLVRFSLVNPGDTVPSPTGRYGIRTGKDVGFFVLDLDLKNGRDGYASLTALAAGRPLPPTYSVPTPSGGLHIYYGIPDGDTVPNSQGTPTSGLGDGLDVRGEGGYVVAEGTTHAKEGVYGPSNKLPMADAPEWLLVACRNGRTGKAAVVDGLPMTGDWLAGVREAFRAECLAHPVAVSGQGGHQITWALAIRGAKHYGLPSEYVALEMLAHYSPRCVPPWSAEEIAHKAQGAASAEVPLGTYVDAAKLSLQISELAAEPVPTPPMLDVAPPPRARDVAALWQYSFWPALAETPSKTRKANLLEVVSILCRTPVWAGVWQFDLFSYRAVAVNPPCPLDAERGSISKTDVSSVQCWFAAQGLIVAEPIAKQAIWLAAKSNVVDSLRAYVDSLPTMPLDEARTWATELAHRGFGSDSPGAATFVRKTLIAAIRRAYIPGYKFDDMLVLIGEQDLGKTRALASLFEAKWFRAQMPSLSDRDGSHALLGYWGVNFDEMKALLVKEHWVVKDYLSRPEDIYREFGDAGEVRILRRCVFLGTSNKEEGLLRDPTGERRYHILTLCRKCDADWIAANRDTLWSAAKALAASGEITYLTTEEKAKFMHAAQADYIELDAWESRVQGWAEGREGFTVQECFIAIFGGHDPTGALERLDGKTRRKVGNILTRAGFSNRVVRKGNVTERLWGKAWS